MTRDHSVAEAAESEADADSHAITRAVGGDAVLELEELQDRIQMGDRFLLCTDGLTREVSDAQIADLHAARGHSRGGRRVWSRRRWMAAVRTMSRHLSSAPLPDRIPALPAQSQRAGGGGGSRAMAKQSSQKFIARNRAPRVQIEYDVELYGAEKKVQLPFVMGVLADLSGKPADPLAPVADRKFLEIDVDNFDSRMKAHGAAGGVPGAEHVDGRGQLERRVDVRAHGGFLAGRGGARRWMRSRSCSTRASSWLESDYLHGRQVRGRSAGEKLLQDPALLQSLAATKKAETPES